MWCIFTWCFHYVSFLLSLLALPFISAQLSSELPSLLLQVAVTEPNSCPVCRGLELPIIPERSLCCPRGNSHSPGSAGGAIVCMPGSRKHKPGCDQVVLVCAESQVYWRNLEKMEIHCTPLRKNLEVSVVILSWPNPWQWVLKAEVCKNL